MLPRALSGGPYRLRGTRSGRFLIFPLPSCSNRLAVARGMASLRPLATAPSSRCCAFDRTGLFFGIESCGAGRTTVTRAQITPVTSRWCPSASTSASPLVKMLSRGPMSDKPLRHQFYFGFFLGLPLFA